MEHKAPVTRILANFIVIYRRFISDALRYQLPSPSFFSILKLFLINPGFKAVVYIRLIIATENSLLSKIIRIRALTLFAIDISPGCEIGPGLRIEHPVGIVIGKDVIIGENVTISQQVTIGEKYNDSRSDGSYPTLGSNISIGAGTIILGSIHIGSGSTLGAQSLILTSVPTNSKIYGLHK
jgi:serine O-acetyltransferase